MIIPEGVTKLESCAISDCNDIETIEIPSTVNYIDRTWADYGNSFCGCSKLRSINVNDNNSYYSSENGVLFDKEKTILYKFPKEKDVKQYKIPTSVKTIDVLAFKGCKNIENITIPDNVVYIETWAFEGSGIREVSIPGTIKSIEFSTFRNCSNLERVIINEGVEKIGWNSFSWCENLKKVELPNSIKKIGEKAFEDCVNLEEIFISHNVTNINYDSFRGCNNLTINCEIEEENIPSTWQKKWYGSAKSVNYVVKK